MTIAFRPKRDAMLGIIAWSVPLLANFLVTPAIVRNLGASDYGTYTLFIGFASYAIALAAGRALLRYAPLAGETPLVGCRRLLPSAMGLAAVSALANSVLVLSLHGWLLRGSASQMNMLVTCGLIAVLIYNQVLTVVPLIARRFPIVTTLTVVSGIATPLGAFAVARYGGGSTGVLLWQLAVASFVLATLAAVSARLLGHVKSEPADWAWHMKMASLAASVGLAQMLGHAVAVSERVLLGALGGTAAVGQYVLALTVALLLHSGTAQATTMITVMVSQTHGEEPSHDLVVLYDWVMRYVLAIAAFGGTALLMCGSSFLMLWLRDAYSPEVGAALRWLTVAMMLLTMLVVPWSFAETRGVANANIMLAAFWLAGILVLSPLLIPTHGAEGLAIARLAIMAAAPVYIAVVETKVLGRFQKQIWLGSIWRLPIAGLASAAGMQVALSMVPTGWFGIVASLVAGFLIFCILLFATRHLTLADLNAPASVTQVPSRP
jgi:hypothetical protein